MFSEILENMKPVELGSADLEQAVSLNGKGEVATLRDWIADRAPTRVQAAFSKVTHLSAPSDHVLSVRDMDRDALKKLTAIMVARSDPDKQIAAVGLGDYSPQQMVEEVQRGTALGMRLVEAVRLNALFIETAVTEGKIRPRSDIPRHDVPDFDF